MYSYACTCIGKSTIENEFNNSELVIIGEVIAVQKIKIWSDTSNAIWRYNPSKDTVSLNDYKFNESYYGIHLLEFKVVVQKSFKGSNIFDTVKIRTGFGEGDCGYPFQLGKKYLIFGNDEYEVNYTERKLNRSKSELKGIYSTTICDLTGLLENCKNEIEYLNHL